MKVFAYHDLKNFVYDNLDYFTQKFERAPEDWSVGQWTDATKDCYRIMESLAKYDDVSLSHQMRVYDLFDALKWAYWNDRIYDAEYHIVECNEGILTILSHVIMNDMLKAVAATKKKEEPTVSKTYESIDDLVHSLMPLAAEFVDDFDWDAIAREAGEYDENAGVWRLRESIQDDLDANGYGDELNGIMAKHARETAKVYSWYDWDLKTWRYGLTPTTDPDHVFIVNLPYGFTTYETESGEVFATKTYLEHVEIVNRTTYREWPEYDGGPHGAWRIEFVHGRYTLVDATGEGHDSYACDLVEVVR